MQSQIKVYVSGRNISDIPPAKDPLLIQADRTDSRLSPQIPEEAWEKCAFSVLRVSQYPPPVCCFCRWCMARRSLELY